MAARRARHRAAAPPRRGVRAAASAGAGAVTVAGLVVAVSAALGGGGGAAPGPAEDPTTGTAGGAQVVSASLGAAGAGGPGGGSGSSQDAAALAPVHLSIPSLGVSTSLVDLGLTDDGALEVPRAYDVAGWFTGGPPPGERGPAVVAGHLDSKDGPGVFAHLPRLVAGDRIEVDRADGSTVAFEVTGTQQTAKEGFPTEAVYGPTAGAELRLITCGGAFDHDSGHYRDNVVVFARLVA